MLQSFRDNTQSILVKIIIGFIIVTFALFGVDSLIGLTTAPNAPVTVNGIDISERQIADGIEFQRRQLLAQMGENADPSMLDDNLLRGAVVQNLIEQELLKQNAASQGLRVSDQFLDSAILTTREFQVDGQFDRNQFEALLRNVGMTPLMYRDYLRNETVIGQGRNALLATAFVLPAEVERITRLDRQTRSFKYLEVDINTVLESIAVDDAAIDDYYQQNSDKFRSEEQVSLSYVELNRQDISTTITVDEAELRSQYDRMIETYEGEEAREAAHILVAVDEQRTEEEALQQVQELVKKIDAGESFADVARQNSDDTGSAEMGGNLGFVEKGIMVPEFEEALFALESGQISSPVRTEFGYHLIQLKSIDSAEPPTFEQARAELENEQRLQKAESQFVARSEELDDLRFSASDLQEASDVLGLKIHETELFGRDGGESALTQAPRLLSAAFSEDVLINGENSELIELDENRILVVHLKDHKPVRTLELNEVRDRIIAEIKQQQGNEQVVARADELLKRARTEGVDAVTLNGKGWTEYRDIGRADSAVSQEVRNVLFRMPRPAEGASTSEVLSLSSGSAAVLVLEAVGDQAEELNDTQRKGLSDLLASRFGQSDYRDLLENLKATAEVERL